MVFTSRSNSGSSIESTWLTWPARLNTTSAATVPRHARRDGSTSPMSASTTRIARRRHRCVAVGHQVATGWPRGAATRASITVTSAPPSRERQREVGSDEAESAGDDAPAPGNGVDRKGAQSAASVGDRPVSRRDPDPNGHRGRDAHVTVDDQPHREHVAVAVGRHGADERRPRRRVPACRGTRSGPAPVTRPGGAAPARPRPLRASARCSRGRARRSRWCAAATVATPRRRAARRGRRRPRTRRPPADSP